MDRTPERITCLRCEGTGELVPGTDGTDCPDCDGFGYGYADDDERREQWESEN